MKCFSTSKVVMIVSCAVYLTISVAVCSEEKETVLDELAEMTEEQLQKIVEDGKKKFVDKEEESTIDESMENLHKVVIAATVRAQKLSAWNVDEIKKAEEDAEKKFDETIAAINDYIELVKNNGPVHKAKNRIVDAAEGHAKKAREQAAGKTGEVKERFLAGEKEMKLQINRAEKAWDAIGGQRKGTEQALSKLKDYKELYVWKKAAFSIKKANDELEAVANDLGKLSVAMIKVQEALLK